MVRVFTVRKGDVIRIGSFGVASNEVPALVPVDVASGLDAGRFRVESDPPAAVVDEPAAPAVEAAPVTKSRNGRI